MANKLTADQEMFVREAELEYLSVEYDFSGPFMEGRKCPAVRVSSLKVFRTNAKGAQWMKDGGSYVIYCPDTFWD